MHQSVATETKPKATADSSEQTETNTRSKETQTQATAGSLELDARVSTANAISEASLKDSDTQTRFYTDLLKWAFVVQVLSLLSPFITPSHTRPTIEHEFIVVLVKLQLNLLFQDLAYRWGVSVSTITRIYHKWINVMYQRMAFLIKWPS